MSNKTLNTVKLGLISSFMALYPNFSFEANVDEPKKSQIFCNLDDIVRDDINIARFDYLFLSKKYDSLINGYLSSKNSFALDNVLANVPISHISDYFRNNALSLDYDSNVYLNRLRALTRSGEEIRKERMSFNNIKNPSRSLYSFARALDVSLGAYGDFVQKQRFLELYKDDLITVASKYDLNPSLLASVALHESGGDAFAFSNTGALGAFGLTSFLYDPKGAWFDGSFKDAINPFDVSVAMDRAADYLSNLIVKYKRHDDSRNSLALVAYNQGEPFVNSLISKASELNIKPLDLLRSGDFSSESKNYAFKVRSEINFVNNFLSPYLLANTASANSASSVIAPNSSNAYSSYLVKGS